MIFVEFLLKVSAYFLGKVKAELSAYKWSSYFTFIESRIACSQGLCRGIKPLQVTVHSV